MQNIGIPTSMKQREKLRAIAKKNNVTVAKLIRTILSKSKITSSVFKEVELIK
jgi:predicted DNA-binding ribbon-helix-helix protein